MTNSAKQQNNPLNLFGRYLSLWVALCISSGVLLGNFIPEAFQFIAKLEYAKVNLVVAVLIWVMIYPMMVNIDFNSLKDLYKKPKGLCVTLVVNWLIKPFTMAFLGILFFETIFAGLVDPKDARRKGRKGARSGHWTLKEERVPGLDTGH